MSGLAETVAPVLDVHVRRKRFGDRVVLADLRVCVGDGEIVALVGASGCGKSTLLRIVAGLDRDADSRVVLDGRPVVAPVAGIRLVFQEPRLFPWLTVAENVAFDLGGAAGQRPRVDDLLAEVGLDGLGDRLPKQLSGGQAQRAALARGLFVQPRLLLLDEPFSAVDAFTRSRLQDLLLAIVQTHRITVLLVTHDLAEAVYLADRVLVLEHGSGGIGAEIAVDAARPRDRQHPALQAAASQVGQALHLAPTT